MLIELRVENLGVIEQATLLLGPGMTVLTGETGAGKTMLVDAIELLVGGRAEPGIVRAAAEEATIEGRFELPDGSEVVLGRVVPRTGRSRAYVDGRLAPASALAEWGERLVDLHGQHAHQSLLGVATQRDALDRYAGVDLGPLHAARSEVARIEAALAALGGDERTRARELDLLSFQVAELDAARLDDPDEDAALEAEEDVLADAVAHQASAAAAFAALSDDEGAADAVAAAVGALAGRAPFAALEDRLRALAAELSDVAAEVRTVGEGIDEDPARVEAVRLRRQLLRDLRRKYGDTLADVVDFADGARRRLAELTGYEERAAALDAERGEALAVVATAAAAVAAARRAAAPELAAAVRANLAELAMAKARLEVEVGDVPPGDDVVFLLAANPGAEPAPLAKVASGGELARAMLAVRLVLLGIEDDSGPSTLVFDEVDAGIGGVASLAVGRALAALGSPTRQVLVVTHQPQVAAFADAQLVVTKTDDGATTSATVGPADGDDRVAELARMLAGTPDSEAAREAARELLRTAR